MKLPQAFLTNRIGKLLGKLSPTERRLLFLGTVVVASFLMILPFLKGPENKAQSALVSNVEQQPITEQIAPPVPTQETKPKTLSAPKTPVPGDLHQPISGKQIRGTSKDLIWWQVLGDYRQHPGEDLKADQGTKVKAAAQGTVTELGTDPVYGKTLVLNHGGGLLTVYAQLEDIKVKLGSKVASGQELGRVAAPNSGEADLEPHLHYEVWYNQQVINGKTQP